MARHMCEFKTDDRVVDELLTESAALVGVFHSLFVADAGEADALDDDADTFMVEVGHDHYGDVSCELYLSDIDEIHTFETLVLFAD